MFGCVTCTSSNILARHLKYSAKIHVVTFAPELQYENANKRMNDRILASNYASNCDIYINLSNICRNGQTRCTAYLCREHSGNLRISV